MGLKFGNSLTGRRAMLSRDHTLSSQEALGHRLALAPSLHFHLPASSSLSFLICQMG